MQRVYGYSPMQMAGSPMSVNDSTAAMRQQRTAMRFFAASAMLAHPEKKGEGEDFCYISECGTSVGVADGVGGWAQVGVDAGEYSRELCNNADRFIARTGETDPRKIMQHAFDQSCATGTSTLCVLSIQDDTLRAANLGDSGFVVLRPTSRGLRLVVQSEEQQHYFNCPRQLGNSSLDVPSDADIYELKVMTGDLVIAGTDGFFDNVSVDDIFESLDAVGSQVSNEPESLTKLADHLATAAFLMSRNKKVSTPFSRNAQEHGFDYRGGKMDDITVVVAIVAPQFQVLAPSPEPRQTRVQPSPNPATAFYLPPSAFTMDDEKENIPPEDMYNKTTNYTPYKRGNNRDDFGSPDTVYTAFSSDSERHSDEDEEMLL